MSTALAHYNFSPPWWRVYFHWQLLEFRFLEEMKDNKVSWSYQNDPNTWFILPEPE